MQRHKKYLVITIWVSAIAFIGAGFVGWGQFSYGALARDAIVVGDVQISKKELSFRYQEIYSQYASLTGQPKLDDSIESQIKQMAINSLISEALILNLAKDWNVRVLDDEIAVSLASMNVFFKDGKFDKQTYLQKLSEKGLDPKDFESAISKSLLTQKMQKLLSIPATQIETEAFVAAYFSQDALSVQIINPNESAINISEQEAKDYWQANRAKFKTTQKYDLEVLTINPDVKMPSEEEIKAEYDSKAPQLIGKDGVKITLDQAKSDIIREILAQRAKKEALKIFVEFKSSKMAGKIISAVDANNSTYPEEFNAQLTQSKTGGYIKPIFNGKEYVAAKVVKVYPSADMDFNEALPFVKKDLITKKVAEKLKIDAAASLKNFQGKPVGLVSRANDANLTFLGQKQAQTVLAQITGSPKMDGFVILQDKAISYRILEQKLLFKLNSSAETNALSAEASKYKAEILTSSVMEKLKSIYTIDFMNKETQGSAQ